MPPKLVHVAARELSVPLTKAINISIRNRTFPERLKKAAVTSLDKGEPIRAVEKNFRPVSILNAFFKIYEKIVKEQISPFLEKTFSVFIAAYRKVYGTPHGLIRMLENWKTKLDNDFTVGAISMHLSKAFDCIPHDLLIAKLHAYGFNENSLVFIYSYPKRRRQSVCIKMYDCNDFKLLCKARDNVKKLAIRTKSELLIKSYKHVRNQLNKRHGQLKREYLTHKIASCKGELKNTWKTINNVLNKK